MSDLRTQLRDYGDQLDEMATPLAELTAVATSTGRLERPGIDATRRRALAFVAALLAVLLGVGAVALLSVGGQDDVSGETVTTMTPAPSTATTLPVAPSPTTVPREVTGAGPSVSFNRVSEPPALASLDALLTGFDGLLFAQGAGTVWVTEDGREWALTEMTDFDLSDHLGGTGTDGRQWNLKDLPREIEAVPSAISLRYEIEDSAAGPKGIVVVGYANSVVEPSAVEAAHPDLGDVSRVSRTAPCEPDGAPMQCDLADDDALWVQTAPDLEWQAVSLRGMGLTKADIWRVYRIVWYSMDGESFEVVEQRVLSERGYDPHLDLTAAVATSDGFAILDGPLSTSPDGRHWDQRTRPPEPLVDLFTDGRRILGRSLGRVFEFGLDGTWVVVDDAVPLRDMGLNEVVIEAVNGFARVAVIYEEEVLFPELAGGEPLSIARMVSVSTDGFSWTTFSLEDALGASGSIEVGLAGSHLVIALGPNMPEDFVPIEDPEWWVGLISP